MTNAAGIKAGRAYIELGLKESIARDIAKVSVKLSTIGKTASMVGGAALGAATGLGALLLKPLQLAGNLEQTQAKFTTMLGSAAAAQQMIDMIRAKAAATPFETTDLLQAVETMLNFGVAANKIPQALDALGNASGGNAERLKSLALVFGQVSANGKMTGSDLLQMVNAGFNPLQEIAKRTGESMEDLRKRMSDGEISIREIEIAFLDATGPGGRFFGLMDAQSRTLLGKFSTLKDEVAAAVLPIGTALAPVALRVIDSVSRMLPPIATFFTENQRLIQIVGVTAVALAAVGGALVVTGGAAMLAAAGLNAVLVITPLLIASLTSLRVAMVALWRPFGWVSVGLLAVKLAAIGMQQALESAWFQSLIGRFNALANTVRTKLQSAFESIKAVASDLYGFVMNPLARIGRAIMFLLRNRQFTAAAKLLGTAIAVGIVTGLAKLATSFPATIAKLRNSITSGIIALERVSPRLAAVARAAVAVTAPLLSMATAMKITRLASIALVGTWRVLGTLLLTPWGLLAVAIGAAAAVIYRFGDRIGVTFDQVLAVVNKSIDRALSIAVRFVNRYAGEVLTLLAAGQYRAAAMAAGRAIAEGIGLAVMVGVAKAKAAWIQFQTMTKAAAGPLAPVLEFLQRFGATIAADLAFIGRFAMRVVTMFVDLGRKIGAAFDRFPWLGTVLGHLGVVVGVVAGVVVLLSGAIVLLTAPLVPVAALVVKAAVALRMLWMATRAVSGAIALLSRGIFAGLKGSLTAVIFVMRSVLGRVVTLLAAGKWKSAASLLGTAILTGIVAGVRRLSTVVPQWLGLVREKILAIAPWMGPVINAVQKVGRAIMGAFVLVGTFAVGAGAWLVRFAQEAWQALQGLPALLMQLGQQIWGYVTTGAQMTLDAVRSLFNAMPRSVTSSMGVVGATIQSVVDWISATFGKLSTYVSGLWQSMGAALAAGNFGLAAEIAMTEVQVAFLRTTAWLKNLWADTVFVMGSIWSTVGDTIRDVWQGIVDWLAEKMLQAVGLVQSLLQKASNLPGVGAKAAEAAASIGDMNGAIELMRKDNAARDQAIAKDRAKREASRQDARNERGAVARGAIDAALAKRDALQKRVEELRGQQQNPAAGLLGALGDDLKKSLAEQLAAAEAAAAAADAEAKAKLAAANKLGQQAGGAGMEAMNLSKAQSTGSFSASAAALLVSSTPVQDRIAKWSERSAKANEKTAEGVKQLANKKEPALR